MEKVSVKAGPSVYPSTIVLVSSGTMDGEKDVATLAWAADCSAEPPMVCIALRPSRYTHDLISRTGEFVINIPTAVQVKKADYCGNVSGRRKDKFAECGFTPVAASKVKAPLIKECPVNVECVVRNSVRAGTHDVIIAEVVAMSADPEVLVNGKIDAGKADILTYGHGVYRKTGPEIGEFGFSMARE